MTARAPSRSAEAAPRLSLFHLVAIVAAVLAVAAIALSMGDGGGVADETRPVVVDGDKLPPFRPDGVDAAVGTEIPLVGGEMFDGDPITIEAGLPLAITVLTHWCPACQQEVTDLAAWIDEHGVPGGVRLVAVSSLTDPARPNFPPSRWLEREGWPVDTLVDDEDSSVATAYGLTATPHWVFVAADGTVVGRASGRMAPPDLHAILTELADTGTLR